MKKNNVLTGFKIVETAYFISFHTGPSLMMLCNLAYICKKCCISRVINMKYEYYSLKLGKNRVCAEVIVHALIHSIFVYFCTYSYSYHAHARTHLCQLCGLRRFCLKFMKYKGYVHMYWIFNSYNSHISSFSTILSMLSE